MINDEYEDSDDDIDNYGGNDLDDKVDNDDVDHDDDDTYDDDKYDHDDDDDKYDDDKDEDDDDDDKDDDELLSITTHLYAVESRFTASGSITCSLL